MSSPRDIADPFAAWREWISESERQWNGFLNEAMATEEFSRHMGQFMEVYLNSQKTMSDVMGRYFSSLNVASRTDVLGLAERLAVVEEKLDKLIQRIEEPSTKAPASPRATNSTRAAAPRPRRTKRPPEPETT